MTGLTVYTELEQGSDEWLEARRGLITASQIGQLLTPTLKVATNDTSRGLVATLVAERITGHVASVFVNADMQRGNDDEPLARDLYAEHYAPVTEVGFMVREWDGLRLGYSPDGLVSIDGLIEVKSRKPKKHLQTILANAIPPENMAQLMAGMFVSGRDWCDYISFCGGMPLWVKRVYADEAWFDAIRCAAEDFETNALTMLARYDAAIDGLPTTERIDHNLVELRLA